MFRKPLVPRILIAAALLLASGNANPQQAPKEWRFAVSGDSRNCGDVVMPAIAARTSEDKVEFYWHLGDFRKMSDMDEDMRNAAEKQNKLLTLSSYRATAWDDFLDNQIAPFGSLPVFLGIGNHEMYGGKKREEFISKFRRWLGTPQMSGQWPDGADRPIYYHWRKGSVDFITLDNATNDQFDDAQMNWFEKILEEDAKDAAIRAVVVGSHKALPDSLSAGHSMNESVPGTESGRRAYLDLLRIQNDSHKHVYVLASHSHFFMENVFNSPQWKAYGNMLPGWIVGTAGAVRYALPPDAKDATKARTNIYGFLLGTVREDGEIRFDFEPVEEKDVPPAASARFTSTFVHWCFAENSSAH